MDQRIIDLYDDFIHSHLDRRLFLERLAFYAPRLARVLAFAARASRRTDATFFVNPFDTVALTARRRR